MGSAAGRDPLVHQVGVAGRHSPMLHRVERFLTVLVPKRTMRILPEPH